MTLALRSVGTDELPAVVQIEQSSHSHPWTLKHFEDSLAAGYRIHGVRHGDALLGFCVGMAGVGEVHLLNLTVAPAHRRQGLATLLLTDLCTWGMAQGLDALWLEVRASNLGAIAAYRAFGLQQVGLRRGYYPQDRNSREDAVVMSKRLT